MLVFSLFTIRISLQTLLVDFSANLDPNSMIFDAVDFILSYISKNIEIPNLSPYLIFRFDQILKNT